MGVLLLNYMFVIFFFRDCDLRKCLHTHLDPTRSWKRGWITLGFEEDKKRRKILDRDRLPLTHATLSLFGYLLCSLLTPINYSSAFFFLFFPYSRIAHFIDKNPSYSFSTILTIINSSIHFSIFL